MRSESVLAWRSRAKLVVAIGIVADLLLAGYAIVQLGIIGLASPGCGGGGCEERLRADSDHYEFLLHLALIGGGVLAVAGAATSRAMTRRLKRDALPSLPVVTARPRD